MALSMEEQKLWSEIASRLSADDPRLAGRFDRFDRRGDRSRRSVRLVAAVVVLVVAVVIWVAAAVAVAVS